MYELTVSGMSCNNCVNHVKKAITGADPKSVVTVELASGRVTVESTLPIAKVKEVIEEEGYGVTAQHER